MSVRLFVGNLPYDVTEVELREFFAPAGPLSSVVIPVDRETGKRRGFAFVEFSDKAHAEDATRRFNNQPFKGRAITVNEARAREAGAPFRSGPPPGRTGFMPRPSLGPIDFGAEGLGADARSERRNRNFGPDSKPAHKRKQTHAGSKAERGARKRPIRERTGGQFFGSPEDSVYEDTLEDEKLSWQKDLEDEEY